MVVLNLPKAELNVKSKENKQFIFDIIRKKHMVLTPEEWVRQHVVHYLINQLKYPKSIIAVEKQLTIYTLKKRFDVLVFNTKGNPEIIVECKAPNVKITQDTFDQIARYNLKLNANYLMVTNGLQHYFCKMDAKNEEYVFLEELPSYIRL
ncbi:type I restriction enzyme HsdR N-terminal domain-containing protein [Aureibaculum sp. 2210JD6-5]|uniref:type I restriction enzyme HsdR N-terminal domain-containing protein n=1 Tax=Aureibaculum sp. 2210JD6-5 TaxID=3103957 RepID=UPI002AAD77FC|nr:type I restriction enzyme HsdR N-terminal domain-containing protein [Aureibaculum sp. 2210JD6-5]MDY7396364.1 type I restriction enzyme HsdR N-terminal domain-containing protein [Aureibaculum sp. 2210JD6-5]